MAIVAKSMGGRYEVIRKARSNIITYNNIKWMVNGMDKQILEILLELQKDMKEVKTNIQEIKETVNRIEA